MTAKRGRPTSADGMKPVPMSWLDRAIVAVAPGWGVRRLRAKAQASILARHYDAAGGGRRVAGWHRSGSDANAVVARDLATLRELSRDIRRNNGWAKRGVQVITNNTVGWGIVPKAIAQREPVATQAAEIWRQWADSLTCDFDGRMNFYGLQRLAMETIVESGEVLVVREAASSADKLPIPFRVRVLEADYLDGSKDGPIQGGGMILGGIELDGRGRRVAYHILTQHPGASVGSFELLGAQSRRVPAEEILHIYRVERPGQLRGVPWLAAAIARLNDFDDYEDAILMQQKIAACFGAFVSDADGAANPLGQQSANDPHLETLEPGHIEYLGAGKTVTFATPPNVSNQEIFSTQNLRRIAASIAVTYEDLTGDYSKVNFSSARMGRLAHWQGVHDWRWNMLIPQLCDGVWNWIIGRAAETKNWNETPRAEWATPPMPMLDPAQEGLAYTRLVRGGIMTLSQAIRERGEDPKTHLEEIAADNKKLDDLGIWLDTDPRRTSAAGLTQERPGGGSGNGDAASGGS